MSPLDVHLKLMQTLPVRTHLMPHDDPRARKPFRRRTKAEARKLGKQIRGLLAKGWSSRRIANFKKCSIQTIHNYKRVR